MADVYIMFINGVGKPPDGQTVGLTYTEETTKAEKLYGQELTASGGNWSSEEACKRDFIGYKAAIAHVMDWAATNNKISQLVHTQTDEDGKFIATIPAGEYLVAVSGRAGLNIAIWEMDILNDVTIKPGAHVEVKLSSPLKSCIDLSQ